MQSSFIQKSLIFFLIAAMAAGQEPEKYPVVVIPGTPSIWSMEQAHYILNRLRANNDALQTKSPGPDDLNPNAIGGIRLDSLQQVANVSAVYNQIDAINNQANLKQYQQDSARRTELLKKVDDLQAALYQDQLTLAKLQGDQTRLTAVQAITPTTENQTLLASIGGKIQELNAKNSATSAQITSLNQQIAQVASPNLTATTVPNAPAAPDKILSSTVKSLMDKAATGFNEPKLAASTVLDNFLRMQYEIVAKQLTLLRDDVGMGQRIVFLEMPTSISAADYRLHGGGGRDKLAQSWWRVARIYREYKKQTSPCWEDSDASPEGHSLDVVAESTVTLTDSVNVTDKPKRISLAASGETKALDATASNQAYDDFNKAYKALNDAYDALQEAFQTLSNSKTVTQENVSAVNKAVVNLKKARICFLENSQKLVSQIKSPNPHPYSDRETLVRDVESSCSLTRLQSDNSWGTIENANKEFNRKIKTVTDPNISKDAVNATVKQAISSLHGQLRDQLVPYQIKLYQALGGPLDLTSAFYSVVELDQKQPPARGLETGSTRAVELIPSQTAINVNQAHSLTSAFSVQAAFNTVFGFGAKGDYELQHEKYDQFMEQEVFASGFGKGQATFGWTFGPTPGTRILNSGVRSTYAVLTVPDDTTALELEGVGCAFPRKDDPPPGYPFDLSNKDDFHCGTPLRVKVGVPDQTNSGAFWLTGVQYDQVTAGEKATVVIRGRYFSPQTTVLVDGHRLTQVVGVGKPELKMDNGPDEAVDASGISGAFEYVDHSQIVLTLAVPKGYASDHFPIITLVSPSRATAINHLTLSINGTRSQLADDGQSLLVKAKNDPPPLGLSGWQFYGEAAGKFNARLTGYQLTNLDKIWLNGKLCTSGDPKNDSTVTVSCDSDHAANWEFLGVTKDTSPKTVQLSVLNPHLVAITGSSLVDGSVQYGADGHPVYQEVKLIGVGFTPLVKIADLGLVQSGHFLLSYVSPTELNCAVKNPKVGDAIRVSIEGLGQSALIPLSIAPDKPKDPQKTPPEIENTVTTTHREKTVVK